MDYSNLHQVKTWRQLRDVLSQLSESQLDSALAVELQLSEEVYTSAEGGVRFEVAGPGNDLLDEDHPVFLLPDA